MMLHCGHRMAEDKTKRPRARSSRSPNRLALLTLRHELSLSRDQPGSFRVITVARQRGGRGADSRNRVLGTAGGDLPPKSWNSPEIRLLERTRTRKDDSFPISGGIAPDSDHAIGRDQ